MGLSIYTGGTFDLIHSGHISFLKSCNLLGKVTISLNTDEFINSYKGKPPIMSFEERKAVLESIIYVDRVIPNIGGADSKPAIEMVNPNVIAIGSDWAKRDYYKQMQFDQDWLDDKGYWLLYIPYTLGISTTEIKRRIVGIE